MTAEEVQQVIKIADEASNGGILPYVVGMMIGVGPNALAWLKKNLTKKWEGQMKENNEEMTDKIVEPLKALSKNIKEQNEFQAASHKMMMEELKWLHEAVEEHDKRIGKLES